MGPAFMRATGAPVARSQSSTVPKSSGSPLASFVPNQETSLSPKICFAPRSPDLMSRSATPVSKSWNTIGQTLPLPSLFCT